ncbi:hypothetical protein AALO_G00146940 [Alosa alosa]|uniref:Uncharacterized protein n=1 Tax=Alosa alosa TaxID=278164 RepID=A0AAV6GHG8_9TELE|nr:hypothetical protein AALO_G00146940 [Alosa alosa]
MYRKRRETWLRKIRREDLLREDSTKSLDHLRVFSDHSGGANQKDSQLKNSCGESHRKHQEEVLHNEFNHSN